MIWLTSCDTDSKPKQAQAMPPVNVVVVKVAARRVPFSIELPATLSGSKEVEIRSRVAGILISRNFEEGDRVNANQSLFTIDSEPFLLDIERQKAELLATKARLDRAIREEKRLKSLRADKTVSQKEYDDVLSTLQISQADLLSSQTRLSEAQTQLKYSQVEAPVSGIVGRENVSEGTYVSGPQILLTQMTQVDPIRVRFGLSEREQLQMRQDAEKSLLTLPDKGHWLTRIKLQNGQFYQQVGQVNFRDVRINTQTGTSEFQAIVPNPDVALRPGQFVHVLLQGAYRENAIVVPQQAVMDNGVGKFVYVMVTNEKNITVAKTAPVEVGEWIAEDKTTGETNLWVINQGLKEGDEVIVEGMAKIFFPGTEVKAQVSSSEPVAEFTHPSTTQS
ncbi:MAG: efflux transporter periplasmic adaptor subunit [Gammaproteobacteria bacterium CG22_combo_CG10-13_8_21_14_all_40_8]|nr:MAG: efflux transporter periplasmic adaptor subunit [Gammaproteobacteria bacterium CG22_combo_CG10-13_8_21_14_all_40_8]